MNIMDNFFRTPKNLPPAGRLALWVSGLAMAWFLPGGCTPGTSSGVDNPNLTINFQNEAGGPLLLRGTLSVFEGGQNSAVDPDPISRIKVDSASFANLSGATLNALVLEAQAKHSAAAGSTSPVAFNISLVTEDGMGFLFMELAYDPAAKSFSRQGSSGIRRIDLRPRPLAKFQAKVVLDPLNAPQLARIYIPGSPFLATLVDSAFVFEKLPEGRFPMQVLVENRVYAVQESLDTKLNRNFYNMNPNPIKTLPIDSSLMFSVTAGPDFEGLLSSNVVLTAKLVGPAQVTDQIAKQAGYLWERITLRGDTLPALLSPRDRPQAEVKFSAGGVYTFQVTVSAPVRTVRDTVIVTVR